MAAAVLSTACGTAVFHHRIEVSVSDPSGRLGTPPVQVSVFDRQSGYSQAWAEQFLGNTSPSRPHVQEIGSTAVKMVWDRSLSEELVANIAVPAFNPDGSYLLIVKPRNGQSGTVAARFVEFDSYFPAEGADSLTVHYRADAESEGWRLHVTLEIPPP